MEMMEPGRDYCVRIMHSNGAPAAGRILLSPGLRLRRFVNNGFAEPDTGFADLQKSRAVPRDE
jgi:hypothetical protein